MPGTLNTSIILTGASAAGKTTLHCCLTVKYSLIPSPIHTTRDIRKGELPGIDAFFVDELQYLENLLAGCYVEESPEDGYFGGAYYGCPKDWIKQTLLEDCNCYVCPTVRIARILKQRLGRRVVWIHLIASERVRLHRLRKRNPEMPIEQIDQRILAGRRRLDLRLCDATIDTSFLKPRDILLRANFSISRHKGLP